MASMKIEDLTDQIKLHPVQPAVPPAPNMKNFKPVSNYNPSNFTPVGFKPVNLKTSTANSVISENSHGTPIDYYRDQVRMLQERLAHERKQHEKDRKRWDSEKTNVLSYQNQLQDQYTNLVDAFAQQ